MASTTDSRTSTPFQGASMASSVFTRENAEAAGTFAREQGAELRRQVSEGDLSIRLLGLLGGLALITASILGFVLKVLKLHFIGAIVTLYTFLLGICVIILETKRLPFGRRLEVALYKYFYILKFVWGRGALYFVAGSLQLVPGSIVDLVVGSYVMFVGMLYIVVGRQTAAKLKKLRENMFSESTLRAEFHHADVEGKGFITMEQFKGLIQTLGMDMNRRETESAFLQLDTDDKGTLTVEEFLAWWKNDDAGADEYSLV